MENVFQFLGLPADHRTDKNVTQHVKHIDEVPDSKKSWPMLGQIKKDGVYAIVVKLKDKAGIFSRTGKRYTNVRRLEGQVSRADIKEGVYIAELCCNISSLEQLSGIVNPNRNKPLTDDQTQKANAMYLAYHDLLWVDEFIKGESADPYIDRYQTLREELSGIFTVLSIFKLKSEEDSDELFKFATEQGEEGIVYKQLDEGMSDWKAGAKGYRVMKRVRGINYDLKCIGVEDGSGKYKDLVANLIFEWKDGKTIKCMLGKGWTHEDAEDMWAAYMNGEDEPTMPYPIGKIFQVYSLQESSKGKLRLPKVGALRYDKTEPDVEGGYMK